MSEQQKRDGIQRRSWLLGCMGLIALCAGLAYAQWFFWGYVPLSTLPVAIYPERPLNELCPDRVHPLGLPYFSPDGKYYIDMDFSRYREAIVVSLYKTDNNQLLGTYSYRAYTISINCWTQDSSGVYISNYGTSSMFTLFPQIRLIPREEKKMLVPCQGKLERVPLLPRLYWGIRCALTGSEHSPFATWFPLVVLLLGLGGMVMVIRKLWKKWINPWWRGSD